MDDDQDDAGADLGGGGRARPDPGSPSAALIALLITIVFYLLIVVSQFAPEPAQAQEQSQGERDPAGEAKTDSSGEAFASREDSSAPREMEEVIDQTRREASAIVLRLLMAARERLGDKGSFVKSQIPEGDQSDALDQFRIAVMRAELDGPEHAMRTLEEIPEESIGSDDTRATREFLRSAIGGGEIAPAQREVALRTIGWWALMAESREDALSPERARAMQSGHRLLDMLLAVLMAGVVVGVVSIVCMVVAIMRISSGGVRRRLSPPSPGGSVYLEVFSLFLVAFALVQVVGLLGASASPEIGAAVSIGAQWMLALVPLWVLARGSSVARMTHDLGWHRGEGVLKEMGAGVFGYLAGLPLFVVALVLSQILAGVVSGITGERIEPKNHVLEAITSASPLLIAALVSLVVLWAPLVEETVFRGALLRHVRSRAGVAGGALLTGVLFAFLHSYGPLFTPPLIALGVTFALLREWRGSLIAPMTAHFLHNATLITLMLVFLKTSW